MAQRLALKTKIRESAGDRIVFSSDFREFVRRMDEFGFGPRAEIRVEHDEEEGFVFFWIPIPGSAPRMPNGKVVKPKRLTKKQVAVKAQIEEHKEKTRKGIKTPGHIPGVGVKKKRKVRIVRKNAAS